MSSDLQKQAAKQAAKILKIALDKAQEFNLRDYTILSAANSALYTNNPTYTVFNKALEDITLIIVFFEQNAKYLTGNALAANQNSLSAWRDFKLSLENSLGTSLYLPEAPTRAEILAKEQLLPVHARLYLTAVEDKDRAIDKSAFRQALTSIAHATDISTSGKLIYRADNQAMQKILKNILNVNDRIGRGETAAIFAAPTAVAHQYFMQAKTTPTPKRMVAVPTLKDSNLKLEKLTKQLFNQINYAGDNTANRGFLQFQDAQKKIKAMILILEERDSLLTNKKDKQNNTVILNYWRQLDKQLAAICDPVALVERNAGALDQFKANINELKDQYVYGSRYANAKDIKPADRENNDVQTLINFVVSICNMANIMSAVKRITFGLMDRKVKPVMAAKPAKQEKPFVQALTPRAALNHFQQKINKHQNKTKTNNVPSLSKPPFVK